MSRLQIEGRKMKYSDVKVASIPRIKSAVNFFVMEANVIVYILYILYIIYFTLAVFAAVVRFPVQSIVPSV
jgi:hypothetical protein